jgi:site-specific DNA-methyltransferase (adenine-specific)
MKRMNKSKSPLNRSISITKKEYKKYFDRSIILKRATTAEELINKTICQNLFDALKYFPEKFIDLLVIDPPYNLNKVFNSTKFTLKSVEDYAKWIEKLLIEIKPVLKETASIYFCSDWYSSISIGHLLNKHFVLRNRITWEREKGRGSSKNWKSNSEDIWFATVSKNYTFNASEIKMLRRVLAPYKDNNGEPKDWKKSKNGNFRLTFPSNLWTDISVPFWSMPENTVHPTQKSEKLIAKLILASTKKGDVVMDPFLGSGTTSVVAKKLDRKFVGVELDKFYVSLTEKRLELAEHEKKIQGFEFGHFWERNTIPVPFDK